MAVSLHRSLTGLENVLLQFITLALGIGASFVVGGLSTRNITKQHARSAFRRVSNLYLSISRVANTISRVYPENSAIDADDIAKYSKALDRIDAIVTEQINTADDAIEDWNELVPEEIKAFRVRLQQIQNSSITQLQ